MSSNESFRGSLDANHKRALRSGNYYDHTPAPVIRTDHPSGRLNDRSRSPNDRPLDTWFKCNRFSTPPQGATEAEAEGDLARIRARVLAADIKANHDKAILSLTDRSTVQVKIPAWSESSDGTLSPDQTGSPARSESSDGTISPVQATPSASNKLSGEPNPSLGADELMMTSNLIGSGPFTETNPAMEGSSSQRLSRGTETQRISVDSLLAD